jgi:hypothetical protein
MTPTCVQDSANLEDIVQNADNGYGGKVPGRRIAMATMALAGGDARAQL